MEMDGIEVFVKVVQSGSFTEAARLLAMPKTTVSSKIARLEQSLGVTLIQRTTRKLNVTPAGQAFFRRCVKALEELEAGQAEVATSDEDPRGVLRVTVSLDFSQVLLAPLVAQFLKKYPNVSVEIISTNKKIDLVAEGVDLAIRAGELKDSTMIARKFLSSNIHLWASPGYLKNHGAPTRLAELKEHEFLLFTVNPGPSYLFTNGREKVNVKVRGRVAANDFITLKHFILNGDGIGLLPQFLAEKEMQSGKLIKILPRWYWGAGTMSFVYPAQHFVPPKVEAFVRFALTYFQQEPSLS